MMHEHRSPSIRLGSIRSDQATTTIDYTITERGCYPVGGAALYLASRDPAIEGRLVAVHLQEEGPGQSTLPRSQEEADKLLCVLAFDASAVHVVSSPAFEPVQQDLLAEQVRLIRDEVIAALINFLTPERLAAAEADMLTALRATDA